MSQATRSIPADIEHAMRREAAELERLDREVYRQYDRDPLAPIVGLGPRQARLAVFGRDPGKREVEMGLPFVGAGGQKVREALYRHRHGRPMPDFDASLEVGEDLYWINTVPYKPLGNKAWPMAVKRRFQPLIAALLTQQWSGEHVITLGREAFHWFGIGQSREIRDGLEAFWSREDRFTATCVTELTLSTGESRRFTLAPLPHPSPLNQRWFKRFPELLDRRLSALGA
ncbi:uracil-DNA glycosylase [Salinicola corii]|uniref:Uracil-DNA glycosylase n=1 Tax=Salinicola corii TaxID=2606937 RepID=A0A640WIQ7_9GAMM|nr:MULTISPECIES: uracil-DNA glycosylase family protein [Salinicola]KAA0020457.1 uracil-DNA glycosylase [Salinicola corii]NRB57124.1 uracil-DNA glycosylase [Salinicola sp.]